jgi:hypothetical protein
VYTEDEKNTRRGDEREREREREREERDTSNYPSSFHNLEVVQSPYHLQKIFHYNHTRLQLLKHTSKRLLTNKNYEEIIVWLNT